MPGLKLIRFTNGTCSFLDPLSGEPMHSQIGPWEEARSLYALPADIPRRAQDPLRKGRTMVIYDVGLGTGANALAVLASFPKNAACGLHLLSIEPHLETIRDTLENQDSFPFISGWERAIESLISSGEWSSGPIRWTLLNSRLEDLPASLSPQPELVFFDMHSPKVVPHLWTPEIFGKFSGASLLLTYSASTRVRFALREAGFQVAIGPGTAAKRESTHASATGELEKPLGSDWFERKRAKGSNE